MLKALFYKLTASREMRADNYFNVLDGWRGISILLVLAAHLLPLGPNNLQLNFASGVLGMSLFFTLSGFLIANFLIHRPNLHDFVIRRFFRIIPLAWLYLAIAIPILGMNLTQITPHFFFYANYPPMSLISGTSHFWSLCVEMQFYVGIAVLFLMLKERALLVVAFLCFFFTAFRIYDGVHVAINTYYRIDEILVGVIVALVYNNKNYSLATKLFEVVNPYYALFILMISCHPDGGFMNYFRPYLAAILVASTLYSPPKNIVRFLDMRIFIYLASVSFALYVIHPLLVHSWLGDGDTLEKYAKRPLLFMALFSLAHLSTFYYEKYWINVAKRLTRKK